MLRIVGLLTVFSFFLETVMCDLSVHGPGLIDVVRNNGTLKFDENVSSLDRASSGTVTLTNSEGAVEFEYYLVPSEGESDILIITGKIETANYFGNAFPGRAVLEQLLENRKSKKRIEDTPKPRQERLLTSTPDCIH
jgi:hypothetical protein